MKIKKIKVNNYRLLKSFEMNLEGVLSLILGKNNSGKTSLLLILDKFIGSKLSSNPFSYDDFNIDFQKELENKVELSEGKAYSPSAISLKLFIEYTEMDDLSNISKVMMDLDPDNKTIVLAFEYTLLEADFEKLRNDYHEYRAKYEAKLNNIQKNSDGNKPSVSPSRHIFNEFMKQNHKKYFKSFRKSIAFDKHTLKENDKEYIDLVKENISIDKIINYQFIAAKRNITNTDSDKTLSSLSAEYYKKKEDLGDGKDIIEKFTDALRTTDEQLDGIYDGLFKQVIDKVRQFGGIKSGESIIKVISTLQHKELLKSNTTVMYEHNHGQSLPENYNGLGYLNLISMIFEIELIISDFRKDHLINETPADINLFFIEEPEAHTHPQMQYIFIKNIKDILIKASQGIDGKAFNLQTIISTHSSHIVSESDFNDIKYFYKEANNQVIAKNLKDLEQEYEKDGKEQYFKFLKQYLTLHRSELFFADKAIFIEGDTERILLPAMMKKMDQEVQDNPLLSQNISIIEVGAYAHVFEKFINFIGLKSLIITDIDSVKEDKHTTEKRKIKCRVSDKEAITTSNATLKFFYEYQLSDWKTKQENGSINELEFFKGLSFDKKKLRKNTVYNSNQWEASDDGKLLVIYQIVEKNAAGEEYYARSFEDAFIHLNRQFIIDNKEHFNSLSKKGWFEDNEKEAYDLAQKCINKKTSFAMEILLNSQSDGNHNEFSHWEIPAYIKEGLLWLKEN